jgi:hypothetical protein
MLKSNGNLGLSEAMIAAAREILEKKLTPAQEKNIDKNHNGKIDKGDFEILHKKKKMMEAKCPSCGKSPCMCESVKKEEVELDEAIKLGSKVKIHNPGKKNHGEEGTVGEIRRGLPGVRPPYYTVDHSGTSSQLPKENLRIVKEKVEFSDAELEMIASIAQQHEVE